MNVMSVAELPINQIICGDCLEVMKDWPDKCVDLVITSPPYNLGNNHHTGSFRHVPYNDHMNEQHYQRWQQAVLRRVFALGAGHVFYNHQNRIMGGKWISPYEWLMSDGWAINQEVVWMRGSPNMDKRRFFPFTERIYWLSAEENRS